MQEANFGFFKIFKTIVEMKGKMDFFHDDFLKIFKKFPKNFPKNAILDGPPGGDFLPM